MESWSVTNPKEGAQTIKEIQELAKFKKNKTNEKYGCIRQPLFPSVPVDHVIPDILHLFLRISDVLINLLILELQRLDGIEKTKLQSFNKGVAVNMAKYEQFLNKTCKVSFHMYLDKDPKVLKWCDQTGPEKLKLFNRIDILKFFLLLCFPGTKLWKDFLSIYTTLCLNSIDNENVERFKTTVKE